LKEIKLSEVLESSESPEFSGKVIAALASDRNIMKYSSKVLIAADYANSNGIYDIDGRKIASFRQLNSLFDLILPKSLKFATKFIPDFIKIPTFVFALQSKKY
jgi:hypothetical protein